MKETYLKTFLGGVTGILSYMFGGYDMLLQTVLWCTILDFATGTTCAWINGNIKARICGEGILKKAMMYFVISLACVLNVGVLPSIPLREVVISFYIYQEAVSLLENVGTVIAYPTVLKKALASLNENNE